MLTLGQKQEKKNCKKNKVESALSKHGELEIKKYIYIYIPGLICNKPPITSGFRTYNIYNGIGILCADVIASVYKRGKKVRKVH